MSFYWNKDVKRFLLSLMLIWLFGAAIGNFIIFHHNRKAAGDQYRAYSGIVSVIKESYPEVPEEEIIKRISGARDASEGRDVLMQYGIFEEGDFIRGLDRERTGFTIRINVAFFLVAMAVFVVFVLFWRIRSKRLQELGDYVDQVSHGDYDLKLQSNQEDELSGLRNELYKLTVLYREQAEGAIAGKAALADSVANISHQLKTPLTSAVILADNLLESPQMEPEVRTKFLQEISRQLVGMKWLVITMLKLSRLDAGVVEFRKEEVSLEKIATKSLHNLEMMAQWKEIQFKTELSEIYVKGDEKWLEEALQNIIKNAIEHSPQGGMIEVESSENDIYVQLSVRDHGEGISDLDQKHLFERFYRSSKVENENVGIGLALAKEIVEKHNGSIVVESGKNGTCFMIRILKFSV